MKITVAAISYMEDQNAPSRPELAEWELSDNPTKEELAAFAIQMYGTDDDDEEEQQALTVEFGSEWGDIQVNGWCGVHLFVVLPENLRHIIYGQVA